MSSHLALAPTLSIDPEKLSMAVKKVQMMSNLGTNQLSKATRDFLIHMLEADEDSWPLEDYYRILYKNKVDAAKATNNAQNLTKKLNAKERLRMKLEAKRR